MNNFPAFDNIEQQEIRTIVEVVEKAIGCIECYGAVYGFVVPGSDNMGILVCENKFGMVEVDFKTQPFFPVEDISDAIIVLWNTDGFVEYAIIPARMIMT